MGIIQGGYRGYIRGSIGIYIGTIEVLDIV